MRTKRLTTALTVLLLGCVGPMAVMAPASSEQETSSARAVGAPSAPESVNVRYGDRVLKVRWQAPDRAPGGVRYYQVAFDQQRVRVPEADTRVLLKGLANGRAYQVKVRAFTGSAGPWSVVRTEHPNGAPDQVATPDIDPDGPDPDPSADVTWQRPAGNGEPVTRYEVRNNRTGRTIRTTTANQARVALTPGQRESFSVRAFNRPPTVGAGDGWGEWSQPSTTVAGAKPPGPVKDLRASATGVSGQARITFAPADVNGAESIRYRYSVQGGVPADIVSGQAISGLPNGSERSVEVWAISTANGKDSAPGPREGDGVNAFAPCGVSVSKSSENYDNVMFNWSVTSNGRSCRYVGSPNSNPNGTTATRVEGSTNVGSGPRQNVTFTLSVDTLASQDGDPSVATVRDSASGSTWSPYYSVRHAGTCNTGVGCRVVEIRLTDYRPGASVTCTARGVNAADYRHTFRTDGSGDTGWSSQNDAGGYLFDTEGTRFSDGNNTGEFNCS